VRKVYHILTSVDLYTPRNTNVPVGAKLLEITNTNYLKKCSTLLHDILSGGFTTEFPIRLSDLLAQSVLGRKDIRSFVLIFRESRVVQSVQCLTTEFEYRVRSLTESEDFSSNLCAQTGSGAHPASCTVGTGGSFRRGKARPGRDADHSPPSNAEIRKE
jgi:hypothetical protein